MLDDDIDVAVLLLELGGAQAHLVKALVDAGLQIELVAVLGAYDVGHVLVERQRAEHRPMFMDYLLGASRGQIFPEGGGQLIRDKAGEVIGAVGVTGDTQEQDHALATFGIKAAGLLTDDDCAQLGKRVRVTRD